MSIYRTAATGTGLLAESFAVPVGQVYQVISVALHLNTAPTTSENLTVTLDATNGAAYDVRLYSVDLAASAVTDLLWQPDVPLYLIGGDGLDVDWLNSNGRTWGLLITVQEV